MMTLIDIIFDNLSGSHHQSQVTSAQVVKTSANVTTNSSSQDYTQLDDHTSLTYDMTPGHKPFTVKCALILLFC